MFIQNTLILIFLFIFYYLSAILSTSVDPVRPSNEWHSSSTTSNVILQCIIVANKLRIDLCLYKNTSGGNHHISNKLMLIWSWGWSSQMPAEFYLFIYFFPYWRLLSSVIDLGAEPFVLWSNKAAYWFIGGRQLPFAFSSCSVFHSPVGSPERKSLFCTKAEALHFK